MVQLLGTAKSLEVFKTIKVGHEGLPCDFFPYTATTRDEFMPECSNVLLDLFGLDFTGQGEGAAFQKPPEHNSIP